MPGGIGIQKATRRKIRTAGKTVSSGIPKRTKAPIIPASTAPTPAGASGKRLATMPRKKPWTTTASGTWTPKAWNDAQRTPMLKAQKPAAPITARPPRDGWVKSPSAKRKPSPSVAGTLPAFASQGREGDPSPRRGGVLAGLGEPVARALGVGIAGEALLGVGGDQRDQNPDDQ